VTGFEPAMSLRSTVLETAGPNRIALHPYISQ
jgi:hypothetical protein